MKAISNASEDARDIAKHLISTRSLGMALLRIVNFNYHYLCPCREYCQ